MKYDAIIYITTLYCEVMALIHNKFNKTPVLDFVVEGLVVVERPVVVEGLRVDGAFVVKIGVVSTNTVEGAFKKYSFVISF